ncbi:MAG: glycosyltransferase [Euryarchaeota archaeon]|nr:glycosyltransferase [Euryarchaeota archaeon]
MLVSVVLNVMNEEKNIADLLDSLVIQEQPMEIVVVDAASKDRTREIVKRYAEKYPFISLHVKPGRRGESTNYGVDMAKGEIVAFIGGDCLANPFWIKELRKTISEGNGVVVGKTITLGLDAWVALDRVELYFRGKDISWPSCNEAFVKKAIIEAGKFDPWFITAEDIDLNLRVVDKGYNIVYNENAVVYHRHKSTLYRFFRQAFWNGAGRKQLTMKHGKLWSSYDPLKMFKQKTTFWSLSRLAVALLGYVAFKLFGDRPSDMKLEG